MKIKIKMILIRCRSQHTVGVRVVASCSWSSSWELRARYLNLNLMNLCDIRHINARVFFFSESIITIIFPVPTVDSYINIVA